VDWGGSTYQEVDVEEFARGWVLRRVVVWEVVDCGKLGVVGL
jgi:hypothetical protein